ncbi:hypothetical protein [Mucilaginibacter jinjuensis]|uniref:Uncharacterized protein n=1 Tax=Mucilaginibacter jinjuensis TaxID=1176721 RepID=A0ABY7TCE0_9SPHI|nr:hypothetical protein [Mucilaginibacter jinjuensis]WCT13873.1 hypothetical protein PQO05_08000 [Mucilaginibacter jinjuensis]
MILNLKRAIGYFFAAYIIVTILASATSVTYGIVFHTPPPAPGQSVLQAEEFTATVPYHVLIMLIIWPLFAGLYFKRPKAAAQVKQETRSLAFFWLVAAMITDLVCFVLIKNPYSLTFHEFYVLYQPWISLIYLAIFLSPWIRLGYIKALN